MTSYTQPVDITDPDQKLLDFAVTVKDNMGLNMGWQAQRCEIGRGDIGPTADSGIINGGHALGDNHFHHLKIHDSWVPAGLIPQGVHGIYDTACRSLVEYCESWHHPHGSAFSPRWPGIYYRNVTHDSAHGYGVFDYSDGAGQALVIREEWSFGAFRENGGLSEWIYVGTDRSAPGSDNRLGASSFGVELDHGTIDLRYAGPVDLGDSHKDSWVTNCVLIWDGASMGWLRRPKDGHKVDTSGTVVLSSADLATWLNADGTPKVVSGSPLIGKAVQSPPRTRSLYPDLPDVGRFQSGGIAPPPPVIDVPGALTHANNALLYLLHSSGYAAARRDNKTDAKFHLTDAYRCETEIRAAIKSLGG